MRDNISQLSLLYKNIADLEHMRVFFYLLSNISPGSDSNPDLKTIPNPTYFKVGLRSGPNRI